MENSETKLPNDEKVKKAVEQVNAEAQNISNNLQEEVKDVEQKRAENITKAVETKTQPNNEEIKSKKRSKKPKAKKKKGPIIIFFTFIILALATLSVIFGFITSKSDKIISGVSINGIDVSKLNKSQAVQLLNDKLSPNLNNTITFAYGDYKKELNLQDLGAEIQAENSVDSAFAIGRSEQNIFANNFKVISTFFKKQDVALSAKYDQAKLNDFIDSLNNELPDRAIPVDYRIEDTNLIIVNSVSGNKVKTEELSALITDCIVNNKTEVEIPVEKYEAEPINIEAIYNEIKKDPVDASFTKEPFEIHKEQDGIDFNISLDEAKQIISENKEEYIIPLKITKPAITVKNLPQEAFPDLLGTYHTSYATSIANRKTNISLASQSVNGFVLMPGEIFSYNGTVGQRTPARGYKEAGVYVNGRVETGYGGGICQVSSTLYNAVLLANLEIVARTNHMFQPGYVPSGQDATVSWGAPDFQFKNNREYPVRIAITADGSTITASIYGVKTENDYTVKVVSSVVGTIPFTTEYEDDSSLPAGATKVIQGGSNGCRTETYKILYRDGNEVSRVRVSSDTYRPHNQVVARGTAQPTPTPTPEPSTPDTPSVTVTPSEPEAPQQNTETPDSDSVQVTV